MGFFFLNYINNDYRLKNLWDAVNDNSKGEIFLVTYFRRSCLQVSFPCSSVLNLSFEMITRVFAFKTYEQWWFIITNFLCLLIRLNTTRPLHLKNKLGQYENKILLIHSHYFSLIIVLTSFCQKNHFITELCSLFSSLGDF